MKKFQNGDSVRVKTNKDFIGIFIAYHADDNGVCYVLWNGSSKLEFMDEDHLVLEQKMNEFRLLIRKFLKLLRSN